MALVARCWLGQRFILSILLSPQNLFATTTTAIVHRTVQDLGCLFGFGIVLERKRVLVGRSSAFLLLFLAWGLWWHDCERFGSKRG